VALIGTVPCDPVSEHAKGPFMDQSTFWHLVERSRAEAGGDLAEQTDRLAGLLADLPEQEIVSFDALFVAANRALYTWEVMGAGTVIIGWLSSDVFTDFRSWVVSLGQATYENALRNPDSLADVEFGDIEAIGDAETFSFVAVSAFESKTGQSLWEAHPDRESAETDADLPAGEEFERSDDELRRRYPRLAARWLSNDGPLPGQLPRTLL